MRPALHLRLRWEWAGEHGASQPSPLPILGWGDVLLGFRIRSVTLTHSQSPSPVASRAAGKVAVTLEGDAESPGKVRASAAGVLGGKDVAAVMRTAGWRFT